MALEAMPAIGFGIDDEDAIIGVIEAFVEAAVAQGLEVESTEITGGSLWSFDPGFGTNVALAVGRGFLIFGLEQSVVDLLAHVAKPSEERAHADAAFPALVAELDGSIVSIVSMAATLASLEFVDEVLADAGLPEEQLAAGAELMGPIAEIAGEHLSGLVGSTMSFTPTRLSVRVVSR
jgi:hypothetical protein